MPDALQVKLGLSSGDFAKGLDGVERRVTESGKTIAKGFDSAASGIAISSGKLKHGITGIAESILQGSDAVDVMAASALRLGGALKAGLGVGIAVSLGSVLFKAVSQAGKELTALQKQFRELGKDPDVKFATIEVLTARLKEVQAAAEKANKQVHEGFFARITDEAHNDLKHPHLLPQYGGNPDESARSKEQDILDKSNKSAQAALDGIAAKQQAVLEIERKRIQFGEAAAKVAEIQNHLAEKLGDIDRQAAEYKKKTGTELNKDALIKAANDEANIKLKQEQLTTAARNRETETAKRLLALDRDSLDIAIKTAEVKLAAAKDNYSATGEEGRPAAQVKVDEAAKTLAEAQKAYRDTLRKIDAETAEEQAKNAMNVILGELKGATEIEDMRLDKIEEERQARVGIHQKEIEWASEEHVERVKQIADEKKKRAEELDKTPQERAQERATARRNKRHLDTIEARDRDKAARQAPVGPTDFDKAFKRGQIKPPVHIPRPGDKDFIGPILRPFVTVQVPLESSESFCFLKAVFLAGMFSK